MRVGKHRETDSLVKSLQISGYLHSRLYSKMTNKGLRRDTGLPVGADAHIKYQSSTKFGAVLITRKPITLTSYNDETLFQTWLADNKSQLSSLHGAELRRYGLRIITRTYTSPGCSIRAWDSKDRETTMSVKAKAEMAGELGAELDWTDRSTDKDWSHYCGNDKGDTVVVFFDGIEVPASYWWCEGLKGIFRKDSLDRDRSEEASFRAQSRYQRNTPLLSPRDIDEKGLSNEDLWGSPNPLGRGRSVNSRRSISRSHSRQPSINRDKSLDKGLSTPKRLVRHLEYDQRILAPQIQSEPVSPGSATNTVRVTQPHKTRFLVPEPQRQRLSTASTATSEDSIEVRKAPAVVTQSGPPTPKLRSALHRRNASPQLRHTE